MRWEIFDTRTGMRVGVDTWPNEAHARSVIQNVYRNWTRGNRLDLAGKAEFWDVRPLV